MAVQKLDKLDKQILRMIIRGCESTILGGGSCLQCERSSNPSAYSETNEYGSAERFAICY